MTNFSSWIGYTENMKRLIFISENYGLNERELRKFLDLLEETDLLERHLPFLEKEVDFATLENCLKRNGQVRFEKNLCRYHNAFTGEETMIAWNNRKWSIETNVSRSALEKYFYRLAGNYCIVEI